MQRVLSSYVYLPIIKISFEYAHFYAKILLQWLSELIECGNLQIGKPAVALWIPMTQK